MMCEKKIYEEKNKIFLEDKDNFKFCLCSDCYNKLSETEKEKYVKIKNNEDIWSEREMVEEIVGKIDGLNLPGMTDQRYNLIFTNKRIIGQFIGSNTAGFLVGGVIGMAIADSLHKKKAKGMAEETDLEKILFSHRKNFAIEYADINEIQLKKKKMKMLLTQKQSIVGKKPIFHFSKKQLDDVESILMKVIPSKTIMK